MMVYLICVCVCVCVCENIGIPYRNMITQAHALNLLIKFVSFSAKHKNIFREVGLLSILTNCLQMLCKELSDAAEGKGEGLNHVQLEMNVNAQLESF